MRNSNPQFFLFFLRASCQPSAETAKPGPVLPSAFPLNIPDSRLKLVTIVTVTVHAHHRKEGVNILLYTKNYPFQKL